MRNRAMAGLFTSLVITACGGGPAAAPTVADARVSLAAAPGVPGAGYFTLRGGETSDALVAVETPAAERVEMHESVTDARGVSSMRPLGELSLGEEELVFAAGGRHLMVHGLRPDLRAGQTIPLTFRFRTAPPITAQAQLVAPGGAGHGMAGH